MALLRLFALLLSCASSPAGASYITPEMDRWLMEGVDSIYRMQFDKAEAAAKKAIELNPEHPYAYMGLAGVAWTRYVYETDQTDQSLLKVFDRRTQETITVASRWLKRHPDDPEGLMVLGAAYGLSSRLDLIRREWIMGYLEGRKAVQLTRAAVKAAPRLWDAYLGVGMYDYYTDVYPRFIGVLAKIVLRGNRLRGINTLRLVAEKGHFSKSNAMILLVEIYTEDAYGARDPSKAVVIMKELRARFPTSAMMHSAELVAFYESRRYHEVVEGAKDYLERVDKGLYNPIERAKGNVALGCAFWALGQKEKGLEAFRAAEEVRYAGRLSRWAVWAHIRAGQLEDAMGRRSDAIRDYKIALAQPDLWDMRRLAKTGLSRPFKAAGPDPIPPP